MNTKTLLIIGGLAVGGYIAYRIYQSRKVTTTTVAAPTSGSGSAPSSGNGNGNGTAAIIDSASNALDTLANAFGS